MRAFRISLVLFSLMVVLIVVSTLYGRRVCGELERRVEALSDEPSAQVAAQAEALRDYWQKQTSYLRPILNRTVVRTMSDLVSDLGAHGSWSDIVIEQIVNTHGAV